jgi:hypothetical protein
LRKPVVPDKPPIEVNEVFNGWASVIPYPESVVGTPVNEEKAGVIVRLLAAVRRPCASTVNCVDWVALP